MAKSKKVTIRKKSTTRKKSSRNKKTQSLLPALLFLGLAAVLIAVLYIFVGHEPPAGPNSHKKTATKSLPVTQLPTRAVTEKEKNKKHKKTNLTTTGLSHLTIYRLTNDFSRISRISIPCDTDLTRTEKARRIIRYLTLPGERDQPPLPRATRLRAVSFTALLITIDLSDDIRKNLINSGTNDEMLAVACLANSLLANFPDFKTLQILIDGKRNKTLAGHIDISRPLKYQSRKK